MSANVKDFGAVGDGVTDDIAAFRAAHDSFGPASDWRGGKIIIPFGRYFLSDTWAINKRVVIEGEGCGDQSETAGTLLIAPPNKTGIRFYSGTDSPVGGGSDYSRLIGVGIKATGKSGVAHGIHATAIPKIEHVTVRDFQGHGIFINGQTGIGATGIADGWFVGHTKIRNNGGDGLHVEGNDSNVGLAMGVESSHNGGYNYWDTAAYCNTYLAVQSSGAGIKSFYIRNGTGLGALTLGCYSEQFQEADFDDSVLAINGVMYAPNGNTISPSASGLRLDAATRIIFSRSGVEKGRFELSNGTIRNFQGMNFSSGAGDEVDINGGMILIRGATTATQTRIQFQNRAGWGGPVQNVGAIQSTATGTIYKVTP